MAHPKPNTTHLHLEYLDQLSGLLKEEHPSQAARLGYIAKQICEKHVIHIDGVDTPKLVRCKACRVPITSECVMMTKEKQFKVKCRTCGHLRRYGIL